MYSRFITFHHDIRDRLIATLNIKFSERFATITKLVFDSLKSCIPFMIFFWLLQGNDYTHTMVEAIADRLAEAFAEKLHEIVRKELWAYPLDENLSGYGLLKVKYQGERSCRLIILPSCQSVSHLYWARMDYTAQNRSLQHQILIQQFVRRNDLTDDHIRNLVVCTTTFMCLSLVLHQTAHTSRKLSRKQDAVEYKGDSACSSFWKLLNCQSLKIIMLCIVLRNCKPNLEDFAWEWPEYVAFKHCLAVG